MIEAALQYIDPFDRDTWVQMAMAIKSELGDAGFDVWDGWAQQADSHKASSARSVWNSVTAGGGITIRTLYKLAREGGYQGEEIVSQPKYTRDVERERLEHREKLQKQAEAARMAHDILNHCKPRIHPYFARKGFPEHLGHVCTEYVLFPGTRWEDPISNEIIIPIRDGNQLTSVQRIREDGSKKFLPGGRTKGCAFRLGRGPEVWLVEGYATGLSVHAALNAMYRKVSVVVCFSAGNLRAVAESCGQFVVADHDLPKNNKPVGEGQRCAEATGLDWWMPPTPGDANDFHVEHGLRALADELRGCINNKARLRAG